MFSKLVSGGFFAGAVVLARIVPCLADPHPAQLPPPLVGPLLPTFSEQEARATGPGHPWQGGPIIGGLNAASIGDLVNLYSIGLQAQALLVTLQTPSGLTVPFSLNHNSQAAYSNPTLGRKWDHSLWVFMLPYVEQDGIQRMGIYWGNHREQRFKLESDQWVPLDGYRDSLQLSPPGATLILHDQTRVEFEPTRLGNRPAYRLDRIVDTSGNAIDLSYDPLGRVSSATDPVGRTLTLTYNPDGRLGQVRYAFGNWSRTWDIAYASNKLSQIMYPPVTTDSGVRTYGTSFEYDARGNIVKIQDPEQNPEGEGWQYGYDPLAPNRLAWAQWPGNTPAQRVLYTWVDPLTRRITDPRGVSVDLEFDPQVRLAKFLYTGDGFWLRSYSDPEYVWAPSSVAAPSGTTWQYDYDSRGNVVGTMDPAGNRTDFAYDSFNNLIQVLQPLVTDAWGNTEPVRRQTDLVYDSSHRLIEARRLALPPNTFHVWSFVYNPFGQVGKATNPLGRTATYDYDALQNLTRVTSQAGRTYDWKYFDPEATFGFTLPDAVVNGLGQLTKLVRDEWGRLRVRDYPTSPDERYSYDGLSRLVRTEDAVVGPTLYTYTPAGLLASQKRGPQLIQVARLPNGLRSAVTESGVPLPRALQYQYGPRNELVTLTDGGAAITFAYDEDLRLIQRGLPNGASASFFYLDGLLASIVHKDGASRPFASFAYTYQSNGQRMRAVELGGAATVRYGYDLLDRLVREERTGAVPYDFQWTYDAADNRLTQLQNGQLTSYTRDDLDGLLTQMTGPMGVWNYVWDAAARLLQRAQPTATDLFAYDDAGRLIHADHAEQGPMTPWRDYAYGALDHRLMRMAFTPFGQPESQTGFFDLATTPFREEKVSFPGGGQSSLRPTFADGLVRWLDATTGQCMYPATDADGSVRAWTDNAGAVGPYAAVYNTFGQPILDNGQRPPYAFGADGGTRNDGDFGWLVIGDRTLYSPMEQIVVGAGDGRIDKPFLVPIEYVFGFASRRVDVVGEPVSPPTSAPICLAMCRAQDWDTRTPTQRYNGRVWGLEAGIEMLRALANQHRNNAAWYANQPWLHRWWYGYNRLAEIERERARELEREANDLEMRLRNLPPQARRHEPGPLQGEDLGGWPVSGDWVAVGAGAQVRVGRYLLAALQGREQCEHR